jgi:hypothetical protein
VLTPNEPEEDGTYSYILLFDPRIPGASYEPIDYLVKMYGQEKAEEYIHLFTDSMAKPQTGYVAVQSRC